MQVIRRLMVRATDWSASEAVAFSGAMVLSLLAVGAVLAGKEVAAALAAISLLVVIAALAVFTARRVRIAAVQSAARLIGLPESGAQKQKIVLPGSDSSLAATFGCDIDYLRISGQRESTASLDATLIRTGSVHGRDLLAYSASRRKHNYQQVRSLCEAYRDPSRRAMSEEVAASFLHSAMLRLARVLALQNECADDRKNALSLMSLVLQQRSAQSFVHPYAKLFFELALDDGDQALARRLLHVLPLRPADSMYMDADLANPFSGGGRDVDEWIHLFNKSFEEVGLEPIMLDAAREGVAPFDRLGCQVPESIEAGPRVTVVMTTWCADEGLLTAVGSILGQSWKNLEVIIVDDASPEQYASVLDRCQALDPRITVVRQPVNRGTYVARNVALAMATGDFVTFQDDDDWSHPRRLERQLAPMLADGSIMMTVSRALRCSEKLAFSYVGYPANRKNASSLMFRREAVLGRLGYMDSVRKGADSEYAQRIVAVFGKEANVDIMEPLAIIRMRSDSLSRSDFKPGWHHPARVSYRDSYQYWHRLVAEGKADPYRSADIEPRPFPVPTRFLVDADGPRAASREHYDFVLAGDWRKFGGPQKSMLEEIKSLKAAGYSVAVLHLEAFRFMDVKDRKLCDPILELLHANEVDEIVVSDQVHCDVLVLRYPPILQFLPSLPSSLEIGLFLVVANQAPHEIDGSDFRYEVGACTQHATELFGIEPIWVPQGAPVRQALAPLLPRRLLHAEDMPGIADTVAGAVPRSPLGSRPVIGRYSRDEPLKFPATLKDLMGAYPASAAIDVRIMGGARTVPKLLRAGRGNEPPANWTILEHGAMPVEQFLEGIDYFVYFDHPNIVEAFGRSLLEAMAAGCVVITHPKFEEVFGEGALYCDAQDVEGVVRKLHGDPDAYRAQSERALRHVNAKFSRAAYLARMRGFRDLVAPADQANTQITPDEEGQA